MTFDLVRPLRNHRLNAVLAEPLPDACVTVSLAGEVLADRLEVSRGSAQSYPPRSSVRY